MRRAFAVDFILFSSLYSVGFETRYVQDYTDHVWCEIWLKGLGGWTHVDPCENAVNSPLVYETGWGKK